MDKFVVAFPHHEVGGCFKLKWEIRQRCTGFWTLSSCCSIANNKLKTASSLSTWSKTLPLSVVPWRDVFLIIESLCCFEFTFFFHPTQAAQPLELSNSSVPKVFEKQCITSNWKLSLRSNRAWRLWPSTTSQSLQARKKREARSDSTACFKCKQIVQPSSELLCIHDRSDRYFLSWRRLISSFFNFSCSNSVLTLSFAKF